MHTPSDACLSLIKSFESRRLISYQCPAGKWTIGWGHTGDDVRPGMIISLEKAEMLFKEDTSRVSFGLGDLLGDLEVTQGQFDALVSFAYNVGLEALRTSTLLRLLKAGKPRLASLQFYRWIFVKKRPSAGLLRRRKAERKLFLAA